MRRVNIDVAVRIRPTPDPAHSLAYNQREVTIRGTKHYQFSKVLTPESTQAEMFQQCRLSNVVDHTLEGYNSTVIAFGQTGAGKTYTMEGAEQRNNKAGNSELEGIVPRSIRVLFEKLQSKKPQFRVSCSFLQIYNERIYDLFSANVGDANPFLSTNRDFASTVKMGLKMRWDRDNQFSVESLQSRECADQQEMMKVWSEGLKNRVVAATRLNLSSSRSHTIFTVKLHAIKGEQSSETPNGLFSKLEFVDLAGSERIMGDGRQLKESIDINKSLFTLRKVINSLESREAFVPYRESKLTSLLKQSFGGNNYCLFVACINPADRCVQESIITLDYTTKASTIENHVERRSDKRDIVIEELRRENQTLRTQLSSCYKQIELLGKLNGQQPTPSNYNSNSGSKPGNLKVGGINKANSPQFSSPTSSGQQLINLRDIPIQLPKEESKSTQFADRNSFTRYKQQVRIDYEYFGERLVESINTVRQLLKSNKKLREELDLERIKCEQYAHQIEQLMMEGQQRPRLAPLNQQSLEKDIPRLPLTRQRAMSYRKASSFKTRNLRLLTEHPRDSPL